MELKESNTTWDLLKYDSKKTAQGIGYAFTRPLHWEQDDFRKLTTLAVSVFALSLADEEMNRFATGQKDNYPQIGLDFGFKLGKPQTFFLLNAGVYGYGLFTKNEAVRKTSVLIISSAITAGLIQSVSKTAFGRARPTANLGHNTFKPFSEEAQYHSFPSGHTVLSVTMAHAIAKQLDNIWLKIGVYSLGSITPITRLVEGAHWLTDVAVGSILSIVVVDSIDKFLFDTKAYKDTDYRKKISWNFAFTGTQLGVIGTF
ncbi:phosphatase PAP2 family protein [Bizionia sp. KMM 8389]